MNREDIIRLAREAGAKDYGTGKEGVTALMLRDDAIERLAALVAAAEREACAKLCDELAGILACHNDKDGSEICVSLRDTIRARGQE